MGKAQPLPILITGGGRRIGLALAWHFINQKQTYDCQLSDALSSH